MANLFRRSLLKRAPSKENQGKITQPRDLKTSNVLPFSSKRTFLWVPAIFLFNIRRKAFKICREIFPC